MKPRKQSGVYAYLVASGVLEHGKLEDIAEAKKAYWSLRKKEWKQKKRKTEQQFTVSFTDDELKIIQSASKKHRISRTAYIKAAALAYPRLQYIVPDSSIITSIQEAIYANYNGLEKICEQGLAGEAVIENLLQRMEVLESLVLSQLLYPQLKEDDNQEPFQKI